MDDRLSVIWFCASGYFWRSYRSNIFFLFMKEDLGQRAGEEEDSDQRKKIVLTKGIKKSIKGTYISSKLLPLACGFVN